MTNTPWGERHAYVLRAPPRARAVLHGEFDKRLHVSPFMGMDQRYVWHATDARPRRCRCTSRASEAGQRAFDATLALRRAPLTPGRLRRDHRALPGWPRCACWR